MKPCMAYHLTRPMKWNIENKHKSKGHPFEGALFLFALRRET